MKELKTYVLVVSEKFPKGHSKEGQETRFIQKMARLTKIHTIRGNYNLWKKREKEINEGRARLSVRVWTGKPYRSQQREVFAFLGIGVQKIEMQELQPFKYIDNVPNEVPFDEIAQNDGLSLQDFRDWFKGKFTNTEMAIIHFTNFRY